MGPVITFNESLTAPKIKNLHLPPVPDEGQRLGAEGRVSLALVVGSSGKVSSLSILRPAGMGMDELVLEAAREWEFEPARIPKTKIPIPVSTLLDLTFRADVVPEDELAVRRIHFPFLGKYSRPVVVRYRPIPWDKKTGKRTDVLVVSGSLNFKGRFDRIEIVRGLDEMTNLEAIQALKSWQFRPAYENNTPRAVEVELEFAPPCRECERAERLEFREVGELTVKAEQLRQAGKLNEALATIVEAKDTYVFTVLADFIHGRILLDLKDPANAIPHLLVAKRRLPYEAEVYASIATAYSQLGFFSTAAAYQSCAVRLRPDWAEYTEDRALYRRKAGDEPGATADIQRAEQLRRPASE